MSNSKKKPTSIIKNLTGAGGSGLVRLTPVESASVPIPQIKAESEKTKKVFCPTIPSGRRIKKEYGDDLKSEKTVANKRKPNIKRDRQRPKKEIVHSESVFSQGPAGKVSRGSLSESIPRVFGKSSASSGSVSTGLLSSTAQPVTVSLVHASVGINDEEDTEQLPCSPLDLFKESKIPPVALPLYHGSRKVTEATEETLASSDMEVKPSSQFSCEQINSPVNAVTEGSYMLVKLPDHLPKQTNPEFSGSHISTGNNKVPGENELKDIPEGCIGTLKIHKSGRTRLVLGDLSLDVSLGTPCGFLQELMCVQPPPEPKIIQLGLLVNRLNCVPDLESSLSV